MVHRVHVKDKRKDKQSRKEREIDARCKTNSGCKPNDPVLPGGRSIRDLNGRECGAELYVIHVIHNPFGYEGWNLPIASLSEDYRKLQEKMKEDLHRIIEMEKSGGLLVKELVKSGEPKEEILKAVREENINLIIMIAHEEGRLEHLLCGQSNEQLIRKMPCSILLLKS